MNTTIRSVLTDAFTKYDMSEALQALDEVEDSPDNLLDHPNPPEVAVSSASMALMSAFAWGSSREGGEFWADVWIDLAKHERNTDE